MTTPRIVLAAAAGEMRRAAIDSFVQAVLPAPASAWPSNLPWGVRHVAPEALDDSMAQYSSRGSTACPVRTAPRSATSDGLGATSIVHEACRTVGASA